MEYTSKCYPQEYKDNYYKLTKSEKLEENITFEMLEETINNIRSSEKRTKYIYKEENINTRFHMIEWIERICIYLNLSNDVFYTTVDIFDEILKKFNFNLSNDDLILIGLTCIFISFKLHDGKSISIEFLLKTFTNDKFDRDDLLMTEILILKTLNFKIPKNYFLNFLNCVIGIISPSLEYMNEIYKRVKDVYKIMIYNSTYEKYDILLSYLSVIYYVIENLDLSSSIIYKDETICKFEKIVRKYRLNFKRVLLIAELMRSAI
jgi:hypothetical protein